MMDIRKLAEESGMEIDYDSVISTVSKPVLEAFANAILEAAAVECHLYAADQRHHSLASQGA